MRRPGACRARLARRSLGSAVRNFREATAIGRFGKSLGGKARAADLTGDASLDEIYRAYFQPLSAAIARTFGQGPPEPEEIVQAAFLKFMRLPDRGKVENARAFLYSTARNIVIDHKRKAKRNDAYVAEQLAFDPDFALEEISPERVLEAKDRFAALVAAMKTLPYKQQVVLTLNRLHGKTYAEIIEATGWSLGDISRNLNAGKEALMKALDREESAGLGPLPGDGRREE